MKITQLKRSERTFDSMLGTQGQDAPLPRAVATERRLRRHRQQVLAAAATALALITLTWIAHAWPSSNHVIPAQRLRLALVAKGHYVRDVAARGTVVAAIHPTVFAIAAGTIRYTVHAGEPVRREQVLATLESPDLTNQYQRECATLDSLSAALARQQIEIRRQLLASQQQADLAQVAIQAAERDMTRAQWAWGIHAMSERDYQHTRDQVATAKLNFDHARETAALERESVVLDLKTRRLERDRQALLVASLQQRVEELTVRSPVDGVVAELAQSEQAHVIESAPLLTVVDLSAFEIEFQVAELYAADIKPGMSAAISLGGHALTGTVTALSPEVRQNEVTGRVKLNTLEPGLRQNERASVRIILDDREDVLKFERGPDIDASTRSVYVVHDHLATRTPVELGAASPGDIEVVRGLNAGDQVIISDTHDFNEAPELTLGK